MQVHELEQTLSLRQADLAAARLARDTAQAETGALKQAAAQVSCNHLWSAVVLQGGLPNKRAAVPTKQCMLAEPVDSVVTAW